MLPVEAIESATTAGATGHNVAIPVGTGFGAGDRIIVAFNRKGTAGTITWPSGWTTAPTGWVDTNYTGARMEVRYRDCDGSETSPISVTTSNAVESEHVAYRYAAADIDTGSAPESTTPAVAGSSTAPNPPSLTPSWGAEATNGWLAIAGVDTAQSMTGFPTNYSDHQLTGNSGGAGGIGIGGAARELNASPEDPGAFTIAVAANVLGGTIAIRPAAAGGGPSLVSWIDDDVS